MFFLNIRSASRFSTVPIRASTKTRVRKVVSVSGRALQKIVEALYAPVVDRDNGKLLHEERHNEGGDHAAAYAAHDQNY